MDERATLRCDTATLRRLVDEVTVTADAADPTFPVVRLSLTAGCVAATTPGLGDGPTYALEYDPDFFDAYHPPADPLVVPLATAATRRWLDWFEGDALTVRFLGDDGVASGIELDDGEYDVQVGPLPADAVGADLDAGRPDGFDDGRFAPGGTPASTTVETTAETLERLVDAAQIVGDEGVPVVVADGTFRLSVGGDVMDGTGTLPGTVTGPDCANRYGAGLAAIARALRGPVTLQVVPNGPLAVSQETTTATRRYVCRQSM